jgi:heme/copper-type cytochrome/quinol oxidase subunit 2
MDTELVPFAIGAGFWLWVMFRFFQWRARTLRLVSRQWEEKMRLRQILTMSVVAIVLPLMFATYTVMKIPRSWRSSVFVHINQPGLGGTYHLSCAVTRGAR